MSVTGPLAGTRDFGELGRTVPAVLRRHWQLHYAHAARARLQAYYAPITA